jgi:4a-hydroxytetrahydrobiopterin dehydratase
MNTVHCPEGWSSVNNAIQRAYTFDSFTDAIAFVNDVARLAESQNHHPDIIINYRKVTLTLTTHDTGGITEKDFLLAVSINELLS